MQPIIRVTALATAVVAATVAGVAAAALIGPPRDRDVPGVVGASSAASLSSLHPVAGEAISGLETAEQHLREITGSACSGGGFVTIGFEPGVLDRAKDLGPTANTWVTKSLWVGDRDAALATLGGKTIYLHDEEVWVLLDSEQGPYALQLQKTSYEGITLWVKGDQVVSLDPSACQ